MNCIYCKHFRECEQLDCTCKKYKPTVRGRFWDWVRKQTRFKR